MLKTKRFYAGELQKKRGIKLILIFKMTKRFLQIRVIHKMKANKNVTTSSPIPFFFLFFRIFLFFEGVNVHFKIKSTGT